ncbi:MAG: ABC transporter ATP-binding protein [Candidatus Marinimicrobia bacterium]|jgi:subfamily B ATP-binding cassette protein MsbA|nr:ABC transporter ATP-binding protein [Candidatus Neomarinimicrobiota bacterium]MBT3502090.1 ABC transporter ATP-binding protein [Candidatus Neomarinimicrobiota bacterium]MBT3840467.1 ABC transporter ATP-binding protein [Candidatus Neomarinimicrobiota bacterium]MBT3999979.1 ABC transporter ATP-binding protein [Candidatus Neomarinimicrobiota bacterium]MBT4283514.1 ABC transporter ATP-binding protein [Candidatus Neomarinimicrobiota bacterium]
MSRNIYARLGRLVLPYWPILLVSTIASLFYVVFNSLSIWLTASLINNILTDFDQLIEKHSALSGQILTLNDQLKYWTNEIILRETPRETLKVLCITILIVFVVKNIFLYIKNICLSYVQFNLITSIRNKLYHHFHSLSLSFFDKTRTGELSSIIVTDVSNMRVALGTSFHKVFVEPINILMFITLLFVINTKLALYATVIIPITGVIIFWIGRSIRRKSRRTAKQIAGIMGILNEILNSVRVVKAFGTEDYERKRFKKEQEQYYKLIFQRARLRLTASPITETIGAIIGVLLLWIGGMDVLVTGTMNSEDFIRFILILFSVLGPIRLLSNVSINLQKGVASAERVFEIFDTHVEIEDSPDAVDIPLFSNEIGFHKVCFNYDADAPVIQDVSFSIPRGKVVAIVGPSGAGKSTIADLIPRFYDVDSGSISIDGIDIRHVKLISLRSKMGIVTQETILFDETIEFNIAYGIEHYTQEKLNAATQAANAYDFILEQPQGFQTIIGEKGIKLSGGQRQRIAIARAILRNPPILILDEATSSLDTESERKVQLALENLMRDRTTLVIAHRLSTIQRADIIIVLDKGCIMETGNHLSLLNKGGLYQKLYENMSVK